MFCPQCGSSVPDNDNEDFCLRCGKNLEKKKFKGPVLESDLEISIEGDEEALLVLLNTIKKFNLKVKNNSLNTIYDVKVNLSGPPQVALLSNRIIFQAIGAKSTISAPVRIIPEETGIFTLSAELLSNAGHTLTFLIELRCEAPKII